MNTPTDLYQHHGVMMQINQTGVLIIGEPGIGKSSFALELLHQGHQLIADDIVDCELSDDTIKTSCPSMLQGLLHTRELGIIDVVQHFGKEALQDNANLNVIVELTNRSHQTNSLDKTEQLYSIFKQVRPLLTLNINSPASCYHRLISWLNNQNLPNASAKLIDRQQQALVNTHS
jgi:HPr kinase/phosphorylase